ncbi:MAG: signal peptidase I [Xanthobacteraceae bacterium]|nr:signal peptidase I [Xanthobacteraceae bacterium]
MPIRCPKSLGMTLRSVAAAALAAAALHLGLIAGSGPARADIFSIRKFSIPSTSMAPTLLVNEYIFTVDRPRVSRGDLVVYRLPKDNSTVYIKRVIGMPGDRVQVVEGPPAHQWRAHGARAACRFPVARCLRQAATGQAVPGNAARRAQSPHSRGERRRLSRQHPGVRRSRRPLFHDGRQPGQLVRQPVAGAACLRSRRQHRRPSGAGLFLDGRG